MSHSNASNRSDLERRQFIQWVALSSLALTLPLPGCKSPTTKTNTSAAFTPEDFKNVFDLEKKAKLMLGAYG